MKKTKSLGRNIVSSQVRLIVMFSLKVVVRIWKSFPLATPVSASLLTSEAVLLNLMLCRGREQLQVQCRACCFHSSFTQGLEVFSASLLHPHTEVSAEIPKPQSTCCPQLKITLTEFTVCVGSSVNHTSPAAVCFHIEVRNIANWCIVSILQWR